MSESVIDYSFWETAEDGYDNLIGKDLSEGSADDYFPVSYMGVPGTYTFRIYPEMYNGKPRVIREVWCNKLPDGTKVICKRDDNRIRDVLKKCEEAGMKSGKNAPFKFRVQKYGILMVNMYKRPDNKYVKEGVTALVLRGKHLEALDGYFKSLQDNDVSVLDYLNPTMARPAISVTITGESKNQKITVSQLGGPMKPTMLELPPMTLPGDHVFTGLDDIYVKPDDFVTDEQVEEFVKYMEDALEDYLEYKSLEAGDPDEAAESGYAIPESDDEDELGK